MRGTIFLVGAGPGEPGLLTLRGRELLAAADAVVYDALVNPELLKHAPRAEHVFAGKQAGRHSLPQADINELLLDLSQRHRAIVRLKGGDPFVLGRGGEEALFLRAQGVPFEVVPGVSAGIAVPAYAGIPVTHRGLARSVTFITGHTGDSPSDGLNHADVPREGTIVVFMGVRGMRGIVKSLMLAGRNGSTPAALISWGTYPTQRTLLGTLETIVQRAEDAEARPPALLVVGEVAALHNQLDWYERRPLFGKRILLTHSAREHDTLADGLRALGAEVHVAPAVRILTAQAAQRLEFSHVGAVLLMSANAVAWLFEQLAASEQDVRAVRDARIVTVGESARQALCSRFVVPDRHVDKHEPRMVLDALQGIKGSVMLPRADLGRRVWVKTLANAGCDVKTPDSYEVQEARHGGSASDEQLAAFAPDLVVFTNAAAVRSFASQVPLDAWPNSVASIGPATTLALVEAGRPPDIQPSEATVQRLVDAIAAALQ